MVGVIRRLARFLRLGKERYYVGSDLAGNSFYEIPNALEWRPSRRTVDYAYKTYLSEYHSKDLPVQWYSWLRNTRKEPPTIAELTADARRRERMKTNVQILEEMYQVEKRRLHQQEILARQIGNDPLDNLKEEATAAVTKEAAGETQPKSVESSEEELKKQEQYQREFAMMRREHAKSKAKHLQGNPDEHYEPETWTPTAPRKRL